MAGGKVYYKGGNNDPLPLSTEGCTSGALSNTTSTMTTITSIDVHNSTLSPNLVYNEELQINR